MMRNTILLLLLIFSFSACNDDDTVSRQGQKDWKLNSHLWRGEQ